jgi:pimeloyl-ACP methyl ester carboxylesterase
MVEGTGGCPGFGPACPSLTPAAGAAAAPAHPRPRQQPPRLEPDRPRARTAARSDRHRLAGHGETPAQVDSASFAGLVRSVDAWLDEEGLAGADMVGSSMGARLVLELARRERAGAVVALDPGGFWQGWERQYTYASLRASAALLRTLKRMLPALSHNAASRSALLAQLSARPWRSAATWWSMS